MADAKYTTPDVSRITGDTFGVHVISNSVDGLTSATNALPTSDLLYKNNISAGNVTGVNKLYKFGRNDDINGAEETLWDAGGTYAYPSSAATMTATSDAAGTDNGVKVTIQGLDGNYDEASEEVTLAGAGTATTTQTFLRVFRSFVSGSQEPTDNINIANGGTTYARITLGENQTQMALWTVPAGYTFFLYQVDFTSAVSLANTYCTTRLKIRKLNEVFRTLYINQLQSGTHVNDIVLPTVIPEKTDIECTAISTSNNNPVSASFAGLYIQN